MRYLFVYDIMVSPQICMNLDLELVNVRIEHGSEDMSLLYPPLLIYSHPLRGKHKIEDAVS